MGMQGMSGSGHKDCNTVPCGYHMLIERPIAYCIFHATDATRVAASTQPDGFSNLVECAAKTNSLIGQQGTYNEHAI